jgi:hypothetical protein
VKPSLGLQDHLQEMAVLAEVVLVPELVLVQVQVQVQVLVPEVDRSMSPMFVFSPPCWI